MAKKYIDANQKVHFLEYDDIRKDFITVEKTIADCLDYNCDEGCPEPADVEEVKHGEWINAHLGEDSFRGDEWYHTCSNCNTESRETFFDFYCPVCGAHMDSKKGEK